LEIVQLGLEHEAALREFLADFAEAGESTIPAYFGDPGSSHAEIVETFARQSRGEGLEEGRVPGTTLFLVHEDRILGVANLRHRLTEHLLRFGGHVGFSVRPSERCNGHATRLLEGVIEYTRANLEIDRLLVTCDPENVASARVIEKCGGVFEGESFYEPIGRAVRRYWIPLRRLGLGELSGKSKGAPDRRLSYPLKP
jgi:predicted acetyltransferase